MIKRPTLGFIFVFSFSFCVFFDFYSFGGLSEFYNGFFFIVLPAKEKSADPEVCFTQEKII